MRHSAAVLAALGLLGVNLPAIEGGPCAGGGDRPACCCRPEAPAATGSCCGQLPPEPEPLDHPCDCALQGHDGDEAEICVLPETIRHKPASAAAATVAAATIPPAAALTHQKILIGHLAAGPPWPSVVPYLLTCAFLL